MDAGPEVPPQLAATAPWLADARERMARMLRSERLPHALLLQGQPGLGKRALAEWIARFALCEAPAAGPCGTCQSCALYAAGSHPDLRRVGVPEDKKEIPVEAVRELIQSLRLRSYRGRRKVAIVDPADAMNASGANALLKTLEEPSAEALIVLTVSRPERLPPTVASRCQRIRLRPPPPEAALHWLQQLDASVDWAPALAFAAGAPLAALALAAAPQLDKEMAEIPQLLSRPEADIVGLAERCQQRLPAERLRWIENWVTERIRRALLAPAADHSPATTGLPAGLRTRHIQGLYKVLDEARAAQRAIRGPANVAMLFERLFVLLAGELEVLRTRRARS